MNKIMIIVKSFVRIFRGARGVVGGEGSGRFINNDHRNEYLHDVQVPTQLLTCVCVRVCVSD